MQFIQFQRIWDEFGSESMAQWSSSLLPSVPPVMMSVANVLSA